MPLNPDVVLQPHYVEKLVSLLTDKGVSRGIGKLMLASEDGEFTNRIYSAGHALRRDGYAFNIGYGMKDDGQYDTPREVFGVSGAACLISYDLINALAPDDALYDVDMFLYSEDVDLDWQARTQGWQCWYTPDAVAYHRGSRPSESLRAEALVNRYVSVIKNAYPVDLITYNLPIIVIHCLLRLIFTPSTGIRICKEFLRKTPRAWRKRQKAQVPRRAMLRWFRWSSRETASLSRTWMQRFGEFIHRRLFK
jgi:GT2 family glycosyltransferase